MFHVKHAMAGRLTLPDSSWILRDVQFIPREADSTCGRVSTAGGSAVGRIVAIANQKGGVGKTTTAVNLGAALAIAERRVLLVDVDPQANLTRSLGFGEEQTPVTVYDGLLGEAGYTEALLTVPGLEYLAILPSERDLVGAEVELVEADERWGRLRKFLDPARDRFEHILVDSPPSQGLLSLNALVAADGVMIPVQCEYLALEGISQMLDTIERVRGSLNPRLKLDGVLLTMFDERTNLSRQVAQEVREFFGDKTYRTVIPRNVRLGEAPSFGKPVMLYDIRSKGAEAYLELAKEIIENETKSFGERTQEPDTGRGVASRGAASSD